MSFSRFNYKTLDELKDKINQIGVELPLSDNIGVLGSSLEVSGHVLANRLAVQPMEGCDGTADGKPGELTVRRYKRFAAGGAALIWFEATAVVPEGRANPRQLLLNEENQPEFRALVAEIKEECRRKNGFTPVVICQLTHSGRYSKPSGRPEPIIAYNNPIFEGDSPIDKSRIASDEYLASLPEVYAKAAVLAKEAGFDGADIKCCHRYLLSELTSAYEREGRYGGSFDNRTRLLIDAVKASQKATGDGFIITSRLNIYDGFARPYGFGTGETGTEPDLSEAKRLIEILHTDCGVEMINITIGNPYFNSYVNRPADSGEPPEHPLAGVARMQNLTAGISETFPDLKVVSSAHSYLRRFAPNLAAGAVESGTSTIAGFGREAFAYPEFARDILQRGFMDADKCCVACGKCTEMMRSGKVAGCPVRDREVYLPIYQAE